MATDNQQIAWTLAAIDNASPIFKNVEAGMVGLESTFKRIAGVLGVTLTAGAFVEFVAGGIEMEASLHKLSLQTGITVETLSALRKVAKESGTDLDTVASGVNKLQKNMLTFAQTGGGPAADAFKQLGYSQAQVKTGLQDMDTFLPQFAKHLIETGIGGEQAGLAMQLMAKGGATMLPFMVELAKQMKLVADVTTEQGAAAHEFEVELAKLKEGSTKLAISLANDLLPWLTRITTAMIKAKEEGGLLGAVLAANRALWTGNDQTKNDKELVDLTNRKLQLQNTIYKLKAGPALHALDFGGGGGSVTALQLAEKALADVNAQLKTTLTYRKSLAEDAEAEAARVAKPANKPLADPPGKPGKPGKPVAVPGMSEHDLQVYAHAVQAVKELEVAEKDRSKFEEDTETAHIARMDKLHAQAKAEDDDEKRRKQALANLTLAETDYLTILTESNAVQLAGMSIGDQETTRLAARLQIYRHYTDEIKRLDKERGITLTQQEYDDQLAIIKDFMAKSLAEYDKGFADRLKAQGEWSVGASKALQNYYDETRNVSKQTDDLVTHGLKGFEDLGVALLTKQKVNYKSFADSIIAELARIEIKKLEAFALDKMGASGGGGLFGWLGIGGGGAQQLSGPGMGGIPDTSPGFFASLGKLFGFASGGSFTVGGSGGTDSQSVRFKATPGERVTVQTPGQQGGGGDFHLTWINNGTPQQVVGDRKISDAERAIITEDAVAATAAQFGDPNSKTSRSLSRNFSVQRSR